MIHNRQNSSVEVLLKPNQTHDKHLSINYASIITFSLQLCRSLIAISARTESRSAQSEARLRLVHPRENCGKSTPENPWKVWGKSAGACRVIKPTVEEYQIVISVRRHYLCCFNFGF